MAKTARKGLEYFPVDVDIFEDDKTQFVQARFGVKGVYIMLRLLAKIYKENGYYTEWDEDKSLLFANRVGDSVTHALVNDVVNELLKRGFFNDGIFKRFKILTSKGIQERYSRICKDARRVGWEIIPKYAVKEKTAEENGKTAEELPKTTAENIQRIVKDSKVKESIRSAHAEKLISVEQIDQYLRFYEWAKKNAGRIYEMNNPLTVVEYHRILDDGYSKDLILKTCLAMHNYKDLTKRVSTNLTLRDWMPRQMNGLPNKDIPQSDGMPLKDGNEILKNLQKKTA